MFFSLVWHDYLALIFNVKMEGNDEIAVNLEG